MFSRLPGQNLYDDGKLTRMLMQMQDTNNGSHMGGLGSVLQKAMMGYQMGKDMQEQSDAQDVMKRAGEAMAGTPTQTDPFGPAQTVGGKEVLPGDMAPGTPNRNLAAQLLMSNPRTAQMGYDLASQDAARQAENEQFMNRFAMQDRASNARLDKQLGAQSEDRRLQREFQAQQNDENRAMRRDLVALQRENRPVQTIQTAEGVFTLNPDGSLGNRLGGSPRANANQIIGQDENGNPIYGPQAKPLPPAALKMQQEEIDALSTAASMRADLGAASKMIDDGRISLGPVNNIISRVRNAAGMSDEGSRNFASLNATLEKLRNDSLRLNKGVQTEGDAVRAWNELLANINDPAVVKQRLSEIDKINERAATFRKMNVDNIRQNYGAAPLDVSGYQSVQPAIGGGNSLSPDEAAELAALRKRFGR